MKLTKAFEFYKSIKLADGYSESTLALYQWVFKELASILGDPEVDAVTTQDLRDFTYHMRTNYTTTKGGQLSGSSLDNIWKGLRSFFRWAHDELSVGRPDKELKRPRFTSEPIQPFTQDEVKALIDACMYTKEYDTTRRRSFRVTRPTGKRDRAIVVTMVDTGIRLSEMCRLKVGDLNLETGALRIEPHGSGQKTKARIVYLGKSGKSAVWKYLADREPGDDEPLFLSGRGGPLKPRAVGHLMTRLGERAGVNDVHPHRFRHTFATEFLRNGGDVYALQSFLGHSTLTMCLRYLTLTNADTAAAHRRSSPADHWRL
jgi:integrase/recombinase XerD